MLVWGYLVHFQFWRPGVYFWLKFWAVLFVLPPVRLYLTDILLSSKWSSTASRPLGLLLDMRTGWRPYNYPDIFEVKSTRVTTSYAQEAQVFPHLSVQQDIFEDPMFRKVHWLTQMTWHVQDQKSPRSYLICSQGPNSHPFRYDGLFCEY